MGQILSAQHPVVVLLRRIHNSRLSDRQPNRDWSDALSDCQLSRDWSYSDNELAGRDLFRLNADGINESFINRIHHFRYY